ncbi:MAG: DEAD/DEAH box helicase family protein, partial [Alphaproteobacteria bacterium]|nr:DEAD/DEAH box helicase family protein [Alphaproteobacteria bacterium]
MFQPEDIVSVYLPLKIDGSYAYKIPADTYLSSGDMVIVPLRGAEVLGIVHKKIEKIDFDEAKLKYIVSKVENLPSLSQQLMDFLFFIAKYNLANFGNVLKMAISVAGLDTSTYQQIISINQPKLSSLKITKQRQKIIDALNEQPLEKNQLITNSGVSRAIVNGLIKEDFLMVNQEAYIESLQENIAYNPVKLLEEQQDIVKDLNLCFQDNTFKVGVLQGLPGSGKTEVYFDLVNKTISEGRQVLILLPEIGLSTQIVERFSQRFSVDPYIWHSSISKKHKKDTF